MPSTRCLVFDRSLTQAEVVKYMHSRVLLNDSSLVACVTMDDYDSEGNLRETAGYRRMKNYGTVTDKTPSTMPFDARSCVLTTDAASPIALEFPAGKNREAYVSTFGGEPYNYFNARTSTHVPSTRNSTLCPTPCRLPWPTPKLSSLPSGTRP